MYIIDKGDKIKLNDVIEIIIVKDKVKNEDQMDKILSKNTLDIEEKSRIGVDLSQLLNESKKSDQIVDDKTQLMSSDEKTKDMELDEEDEDESGDEQNSQKNVLKHDQTSLTSLIRVANSEEEDKPGILQKVKGLFKKKEKKLKVEKEPAPTDRLKNKAKTKNAKTGSKTLKMKPSALADYPIGVVARSLSLIIDLAIVYANCNYLKLHHKIPNISKYLTMLDTYLQKYLTIVSNLVMEYGKSIPEIDKHLSTFQSLFKTENYEYALSFVALTLVSHIVLSTNVGCFLFGITESSSFVTKRIKAFFKALFSILLLPLFPFTHILTIVSKRSLPEVISAYHPGYRSRLFKFLPLIMSLLLLLTAILSPLLYSLYKNPSSFEFDTIKINTKAPRETKVQYVFNQNSYALGLGFNIGMKYGDLLTVKKVGNSPAVTYYNKSFNDKVSFRILKKMKLEDIIPTDKKKNPIFPYVFPKINDYFNDPVKKGKVTIDVEKQFDELLSISFKANIKNIHEIIIKKGPFVEGIVNIKKDLFKSLGLSKINDITQIDGKYKSFFVINFKSTKSPITIYVEKGNLVFAETKGKTIKMVHTYIKNVLALSKTLHNSSPTAVSKIGEFSLYDLKYHFSKKVSLNKNFSETYVLNMARWSIQILKTNDRDLINSSYKKLKSSIKYLQQAPEGNKHISKARKVLSQFNKRNLVALEKSLEK